MPAIGATRDQRVSLALKYHHLDGLSAEEIQQRFEDIGVGEYAISTIRDYVNDSPKEEVIKQIEQEQAQTREQIAERQERLFQRARQAEIDAYERDEVAAMVPKIRFNEEPQPIPVPEWEPLPEDEYPEDATKFDKRIRFTGDLTQVEPGQPYPIKGVDGEPVYELEIVAVRKIEDSTSRSFLRQEQAEHLEAKGEALGIYEDDVNVNISGGMDNSLKLDPEAAEAIRQADMKSRMSDDE